jgi:hypothetical protein
MVQRERGPRQWPRGQAHEHVRVVVAGSPVLKLVGARPKRRFMDELAAVI